MRKYYRSVLRRAWVDAGRWVQAELVPEGVLLAAVFLVSFAFLPIEHSPFLRISAAVGTGMLALIVAALLVFFWSLLWAPVNLDRAAEAEVNDVHSQLDARIAESQRIEIRPEEIAESLLTGRMPPLKDGLGVRTEPKAHVFLRYAPDLAGIGVRERDYDADAWAFDMGKFFGELSLLGLVDVQTELAVDSDSRARRTNSHFRMTPLGAQVARVLKGDEIDRLVETLKGEGVSVWVDGKRTSENLDWVLMQCGEMLAAGGICPEKWDGKFLFGMNRSGLERALGRLRVQGLVEVQHRVVERDRGHPYTEQDFFLTNRGTETMRRIAQYWRREEALEHQDEEGPSEEKTP